MSKALSEIISHVDRNMKTAPAATRSVRGVDGTQKEEVETLLTS